MQKYHQLDSTPVDTRPECRVGETGAGVPTCIYPEYGE